MNSLTRISALLTPLLVFALAGCGEDSSGDEAEGASGSTAEAGEAAAEGGFCATLAEVIEHFGLIDTGMTDDSAETAASAAEARELLESAEPPAELAEDWANIIAFYAVVDDAFAESEPEAGKSSFEVLGDAALTIPDSVAPAMDGISAVENHAEAECGLDAEASGSDDSAEAVDMDGVCGMLTEADLSPMFDGAVPAPEDGSFGPESQECRWETDEGTLVSIMYQDLERFTSNFLEPSGEPLDTMGHIENGEIHQGAFGLGWFDTRGTSMYFTVGEWGGVVSVRLGEDGHLAHDKPFAIQFTEKVVDQLS